MLVMDILTPVEDIFHHLIEISLIRKLFADLLNNLFKDRESDFFAKNADAQNISIVAVIEAIVVVVLVTAVLWYIVDMDEVIQHQPIVVKSLRLHLEPNGINAFAKEIQATSNKCDHSVSPSVFLTRESLRLGSTGCLL